MSTDENGYLLIYRTPDGVIAAAPGVFPSHLRAAVQSARVLRDRGIAGSADARLFANALARRSVGVVWGHKSGHDFRVIKAHFTEDGAVITPGRRLFAYYDMLWGTVAPEQFMSEDLLAPGSSLFDGWYLFYPKGDNHPRKYNGQRLATKEPGR